MDNSTDYPLIETRYPGNLINETGLQIVLGQIYNCDMLSKWEMLNDSIVINKLTVIF